MAGGDSGGKLAGIINLATDTVSSNSAQIFNTATDTFLLVGNLNTARESAVAVAAAQRADPDRGRSVVLGR